MKIAVYDYGSYLPEAVELSKHFDKVFYYCVHESAFPLSAEAQIGKGVKEIEWVNEFDEIIEQTDILFFPDCRDAAKQAHYRNMGKLVFGSGYGSYIENDRYAANEILKDVGLPAVEMEEVIGGEALIKNLKGQKGKVYLKGNFRGDFETQRIDSWELNYTDVEDILTHLGAAAKDYPFVICQPIDGDSVVECGIDTYIIDGKAPDTLFFGIENKDKCYIGKTIKKVLLPKIITESLDKMLPVFAEYNIGGKSYRNFYSNELRIKEKTAYLTDNTCRVPEPPGSLYFCMLTNLKDIIVEGAKGNLVQPIYSHKYGVHAVISNCGDTHLYRPIKFPDEIKDYVKIKNLTVVDGVYTYVPLERAKMTEIGSLIAYDNTLEGAKKKLMSYAEKIEGNVKVHVDCIEDAEEELKKLKKLGITF